MAALRKESKLYDELVSIYEKNKDHLTLEIFNECVDIAVKVGHREIKYILFNLKCLYDDKDMGLDKINTATKIIKIFAGDGYRCSFIIAVLETALEEL